MIEHTELLARVRAANPAPQDIDLPPEVTGDLPALDLVIARRMDMLTDKTPGTGTEEATSSRRKRGLAIAFGIAVIAAAVAVPALLWSGTDDEPSAIEVTTTVAATADVSATVAPSSTDAIHDLVGQYYAAYNAGDLDGALGLLSSFMREVNPATMGYWVEALGETVDAECVDAPDGSEAIVCRERYTDPLHALSGTHAETAMRYSERDGLLLQNHDSQHFLVPGCQQSRCPGAILESDETVLWSYEQIEIDFFTWLESSYPEVAIDIGDASRLGYYAADAEATALALPYLDEFAESGVDAAPAAPDLPDFTGMTTMEAVEAVYDVINSHDAEAFEAFFGSAPDDPTAWFWAQGRVWTHDCRQAEGEPDVVRCSIAVQDDFYTRAGAVFEAVEVWTMSGGELFSSIESANSSGHWAYSEFERDYARWMRETYPELADTVFVGVDFKHNGEAATIAVEYLDEFLEESEKYPRDPDARNDWRG